MMIRESDVQTFTEALDEVEGVTSKLLEALVPMFDVNNRMKDRRDY